MPEYKKCKVAFMQGILEDKKKALRMDEVKKVNFNSLIINWCSVMWHVRDLLSLDKSTHHVELILPLMTSFQDNINNAQEILT